MSFAGAPTPPVTLPTESAFFFAACQPGGEAFLKAEVARTHPSAKLAYSRPGVVTFKGERPVALSFAPGWIFARERGIGLGRMEMPAIAALRAADPRVRCAIFPRDPSVVPVEDLEAVRAALGAANEPPPADGDPVIDVIVGAPGEPLLVGAHTMSADHPRVPGGFFDVPLPADAPSRAYLKIEEAIAWSGASPREGEVALEVGSAPGGACFALLQRGLTVHGVDPGEMAANVLASPRFVHHPIPVGALKREALPRPVHWFLLDVNLAAPVALKYAERVIGPLRSTLRGAFLTLKLNSLREAEALPSLVERVRGFGFESVAATQLPSHRQEIVVVALRREGGTSARRGSRPGAAGSAAASPARRASRPPLASSSDPGGARSSRGRRSGSRSR